MRRLILFRHAKAESRAPGGGDIDRALTAKGARDAAIMGGVLARADLAPDLALVSSALRALQTWDGARAFFPGATTQVRAGLFNATPEEVAAELEVGTAGADTVIVVGHNPSLQELALNLAIDGDGAAADIEGLSARFATATAAVFRVEPAGQATLEVLFHARDHGGEGE